MSGEDEARDAALARVLYEHLGRHPKRERGCVVCAVLLAHFASWRERGGDAVLEVVTPHG